MEINTGKAPTVKKLSAETIFDLKKKHDLPQGII